MEFMIILYDVVDWKMGRYGIIWWFYLEGDLLFDMLEFNVFFRYCCYCVVICGVFE